jgi:uncharacterized protein (UPF0333 family)
MSSRHKRGQSTLEYVLLVTAVIVIIIGLVASPGSPFRSTLNKTLNSSIGGMETMANRLNNSH